MSEEKVLKRGKILCVAIEDPRSIHVTFNLDEEGNLIRVPLNKKPYQEIDDLVRPDDMKSENPGEFFN